MHKGFEEIKKLVDELKNLIDDIEKQKPYQSEVGKSFQQRLSEKMEKKERGHSTNDNVREWSGVEKIL